ncbi:aldolase [Flindersiella endophytica]
MGPDGLHHLARDNGTFLMVAMDQRESLRAMLADVETPQRKAIDVPDSELITFKQDVANVLAPEASGFLVDPEFGTPILRTPMSGTGLIVAADALSARPGEVVGDAVFDESLDLSGFADRGVAAAKLLVLWREDGGEQAQVAQSEKFVAACRAAGLMSIVEGVVRPPTPDPEAAIRCAEALGATGPTLYKVEVPYHGKAEPGRITEAALRLTAVLPCPWVVLSSHVDRADFPAAVEAACRGGASGLLAGRALWTNALTAADRKQRLRTESVPYLRELSRIVSSAARPWNEVAA